MGFGIDVWVGCVNIVYVSIDIIVFCIKGGGKGNGCCIWIIMV